MECIFDCGSSINWWFVVVVLGLIVSLPFAVAAGYKFVKKLFTHNPTIKWVPRVKKAAVDLANAGATAVGAKGKAGEVSGTEVNGNCGCKGNGVFLTVFLLSALVIAISSCFVGYVLGAN